MRQRCGDEARKNYGGRGITFCDDWSSFDPFKDWALSNGYADDLTLERRDVNGNYEPDNCTWADAKTQSRNRRFTLKAPDGRTWAEIAEQNGIPTTVMQNRIHAGGWPAEIAATWPLGKRRNQRKRDLTGKFASGPKLWRR